MEILSVMLDGNDLSEGSGWLKGNISDYTIKVLHNVSSSVISDLNVTLNDAKVATSLEEGKIIISEDAVKENLGLNNSLSVQIINNYGTELLYTISFN